MFMNILDVTKTFPDQDACIYYLEGLKWSGKPTCPYCKSQKFTSRKNTYRYQCNSCNISYSVLLGSIFEGTKLPLQKWFLAMALILNAKKGISSRQLGRDLGVNRNTSWYLQMRIRKAMEEDNDKDLFSGIVEVDETYIGGGNGQSLEGKA